MRYSIQKKTEYPAYLQLYQLLREDIVSGIYPHGSKLPSKRLLAEESGVSVITVEHAYSLLIEEGYIETRQRSGYYVLFHVNDGFAVAENRLDTSLFFAEKDIISAEKSTELMQFPFSVLARSARGVLSDYKDQILSLSPQEGSLFFRNEISRYLARSRGFSAPPERIVIGSGSEYLYNLIIGLLGREKIYGIEDPSYPIIEKTYQISGVKYELLPIGPDGIDSLSLKKSAVDVLHLTPFRSFPSGVSASVSKRHEYLRWADKEGRYLVEDDYESEFSVLRKPVDTLASLSKRDNVIYLNTFSKSISPSLRVGYMILPEHLLLEFKAKFSSFSCTVSTAIQYVIAELLRNGDFERHINRVRRKMRKEQQSKTIDKRNSNDHSHETKS